MRKIEKRGFTIAIVAIIGVVLLSSGGSTAQDKTQREFYQATAMGQAQELGRTFSVNISINEYSPAEDQKNLLEAFNSKGMEGLSNALSKMSTKGRLAITGTLGYDISYIRSFPGENGARKIRLITERPIRFGEAWGDTRSMDYNLSALELTVSTTKGVESTGILLPLCQFKLDKENHVTIETYKNPWKLVNIQNRSD